MVREMAVKKKSAIAVLAFLLPAVAGCASASPTDEVSASRLARSPFTSPNESEHFEISGTVVMVGGPWPDRHIRPKESTLSVENKSGKVIRKQTVLSGKFRFFIPEGAYRVTVSLADMKCGPPQQVTMPSNRSIALNFICPIR
jgi:hypothetical protein